MDRFAICGIVVLFIVTLCAAYFGWGLPNTTATTLTSVRYDSTGHRGFYGTYGGGSSFGK